MMLGVPGLILRSSRTTMLVEGSNEYLKLKWYQVLIRLAVDSITAVGLLIQLNVRSPLFGFVCMTWTKPSTRITLKSYEMSFNLTQKVRVNC